MKGGNAWPGPAAWLGLVGWKPCPSGQQGPCPPASLPQACSPWAALAIRRPRTLVVLRGWSPSLVSVPGTDTSARGPRLPQGQQASRPQGWAAHSDPHPATVGTCECQGRGDLWGSPCAPQQEDTPVRRPQGGAVGVPGAGPGPTCCASRFRIPALLSPGQQSSRPALFRAAAVPSPDVSRGN